MRPPHGIARVMVAVFAAGLLTVSALAFGGCGTTSLTRATPTVTAVPGVPINTTLREWAIDLSAQAAAPGTITFKVANSGLVPHVLILVRTDLPADRLPSASGIVDESKLTIVARSEQVVPGSTQMVTADLAKGRYVLFCNVIGHYDQGQFTGFTVQ